MTQTEKIKAHLERYGSITPFEALKDYGIMRLAARMSDLKREGYRFVAKTETYKNRDGETIHFARYERTR